MAGCGVPVTVPWSQSGRSFVFCEASLCKERAEKSGGHLPCASDRGSEGGGEGGRGEAGGGKVVEMRR